MPIDHEKVLKRLNDNDNLLEILIDIEDFLDSLDLYVLKNWIDGMIVDGPYIKRYFIELTLKYTDFQKPDPAGIKRLKAYDVEVRGKKATELVPIPITEPSDYEEGTHRPKMKHSPVWLIHLKIPRRYIDNIIDSELEDYEDEIDKNDIDDAVDAGITNQSGLTGAPDQQGMPGGPMAGPAPTAPPAPPPAPNPTGGA